MALYICYRKPPCSEVASSLIPVAGDKGTGETIEPSLEDNSVSRRHAFLREQFLLSYSNTNLHQSTFIKLGCFCFLVS